MPPSFCEAYMELIQENSINILIITIFLIFIFRPVIISKLIGFKNIKVSEFKEMIDKGELEIIDVRESSQYKSFHLPGAINIPVAMVSSSLESLQKYKEKDVVVVCQSGMSSLSAAVSLKRAGLNKVYTLKGGMVSWSFS